MLTRRAEVTVKPDLSGMVDGQQAGLAHYAKTFAAIHSSPDRRQPHLTADASQARHHSANPLAALHLGFGGLSQFSYSLDGETLTRLGAPYQLAWGHSHGDRVGLYTAGWAASSTSTASATRLRVDAG